MLLRLAYIVIFGFYFTTVQAQNRCLLKSMDGEPLNNAIVYLKNIHHIGLENIYYPTDSGIVVFSDAFPVYIKVISSGHKEYLDTLTKNNTSIHLSVNYSSISKIVVTGKPSPIAAENSVNRIRIINKQKLTELAAVNLGDALANEINISISQDAQLGSSLSLRGIGGQQIKILVDGIPMIGRNDGMIDLGQINMNNVDHIEIIEGPMSIIYGTDASGGLINIVTTQPKKDSRNLLLQQYTGSNGTFSSFGSISVANKKNLLNVNGTRYLFQGYDENADKRNPLWKPKRQLIGDLFYQRYFNDKLKQSIKFTYFNEYLIAKGTPIVTIWDAIALDDYFTTQRYNISGQTYFRSLKHRLNLNLTNAYNVYDRVRVRKITDLETLEQKQTSTNDENDSQYFSSFNSRLIGSARLHKYFDLGFGYDINLERTKSSRVILNSGIDDYAIFYNLKFEKKRLSIEQGTRVSYNSQFKIPIIPAFHFKYQLNQKWQTLASYSRGFRSPSIKERYLYFVDQNHDVRGNEDLMPENSNSYSFTIRHHKEAKKHDVSIEVNTFYSEIMDMIILASINSNATSFEYDNVEAFYTQGFNIKGNYSINNLETNFGLGIIGTKQKTDSLNGRSQFLYRPDAQLNVGYTIAVIKTKISFLNKYNGSTPNYYKENNTLKLQYSTPFILSDITAMRTFAAEKLRVAITVKNLFDIKTIQNTSNIGGVHSAGANSATVAMGRFYGLNISYRIQSEK